MLIWNKFNDFYYEVFMYQERLFKTNCQYIFFTYFWIVQFLMWYIYLVFINVYISIKCYCSSQCNVFTNFYLNNFLEKMLTCVLPTLPWYNCKFEFSRINLVSLFLILISKLPHYQTVEKTSITLIRLFSMVSFLSQL